jgi:hypothetical protein
MPRGMRNAEIVLHGTGLRIYLKDTSGPSVHVNADGKVWLDEPGKKSHGKLIATLK